MRLEGRSICGSTYSYGSVNWYVDSVWNLLDNFIRYWFVHWYSNWFVNVNCYWSVNMYFNGIVDNLLNWVGLFHMYWYFDSVLDNLFDWIRMWHMYLNLDWDVLNNGYGYFDGNLDWNWTINVHVYGILDNLLDWVWLRDVVWYLYDLLDWIVFNLYDWIRFWDTNLIRYMDVFYVLDWNVFHNWIRLVHLLDNRQGFLFLNMRSWMIVMIISMVTEVVDSTFLLLLFRRVSLCVSFYFGIVSLCIVTVCADDQYNQNSCVLLKEKEKKESA